MSTAPLVSEHPRAAARLLGRMPRLIASADDLEEGLRRSAELVAESARADVASIRIGSVGRPAIVHWRQRGQHGSSLDGLPVRLDVPLMLRGRRLGMLTVARQRRRPFSPAATVLVESFAGPIALAIDNTRLFDALQDRLAELSRLGDASEAVAALGDVEEVAAQIALRAADLVQAERAAVLMLDQLGESLVALPPGYGIPPSHLWRLRFRLRDGGSNVRVFESGRPYINNDASGDQHDPCRSPRALEERSVLIVPLRSVRTLGVLRVSNKQHKLFNRNDARLLGVFAAQAAVALSNATRYQQAVFEREQLKELERLKSQFLSLVSHELRTPLSSIKASAEVLLSTAPPDASEAQMRLLRNIDRSSDRLGTLITDLLDLTRLEGGRLELRRELLDLRDVVVEAIATVRPLADARRQQLSVDLDALPCPILGDRRRLEQVALNLLTNAVKYGRIGGRVWLSVRRATDGAMRLEVRDDGPGIRESDQRLVFERFYRPDNDETRSAQGTGLGLPIARALAELHGGRIELLSEPGRGTTFVVSLPEAHQADLDEADLGAGAAR
ncbi:MAG: GAF domain-containing protein [Chloroflexi bacterium]|nr:GAF domain-containing protein [Chloroflexota bacterium]